MDLFEREDEPSTKLFAWGSAEFDQYDT
jgi:regulator of chromosome condensation